MEILNYRSYRIAWNLLAAGQILLMIFLGIYIGSKDHISRQLWVLVLGTGALAISVIFFAWWIRIERLSSLRNRLDYKTSRLLFVVLAIAFLLVFGAEIRPEWIYAFMATLFATTFSVLYWTIFKNANPIRLTLSSLIVGIVILAGILTFRLYSLEAYPPIHRIDEPWTFGWAISYARTGELFDWLMVDRQFEIYRFYQLMGAWLQVFGEGFWQARFFSFSLTLVVAIFSTLAARNFYGNRTGLLTGLYLLSSTILINGARVRHDIGLAVAISISLWLHSKCHKHEHAALHLFAGLVMGWGLFSHFHAGFLGIAMLFGLYAPRLISDIRKQRGVFYIGHWMYGLGGVLGAIMVIALGQTLPQESGQLISDSPLMQGTLIAAVLQHVVNISHFSQFEFILILVGVVAAAWRGKSIDWILLSLIFGCHIALGAASSGVLFEYYLIPLTPIYGIVVGSLLGENFNQTDIRSVSAVSRGAIVVSLMVLAPLLGTTMAVPVQRVITRQPMTLPPPQQAEWIRNNVAPGATIVGEHYYFLWLTEYDYVSPLTSQLNTNGISSGYSDLEEFWDNIQVDVFLVDPDLSTYPLLEPLIESGYFDRAGYELRDRIGTTLIYENRLGGARLDVSKHGYQ